MSARLAVDIGGTFTDLALENGARRWTIKVLTTQTAPELGVMEGVRAILADAGLAHREDLATWFEWLDADDFVSYGGRA